MAKFSLVRGRALRVTRLNGCGTPVRGPDSVVTTDGFISVGFTANNEEGETISVTNAAGKVCILDEPSPKFVNFGVEVAFCGVDPELFSLMTGQRVVLNDAGDDVVGIAVDSDVALDASGFALELWSNVPIAACDASGAASYGYLLFPFVKGGVLGDFSVENGAVNFTLTGAVTKDGNEWGVGPYDVVRNTAGTAGPLNEAIPTTRHMHMEVTTVAPPSTTTDGATALGVPATTAVAGTPATLQPANSYAPASFATIGSLLASPTTVWTTGQRVVLRNGDTAHWSGTQWVAGPKP